MQAKTYSAYRITHKNGTIEDINALDMVQALENMETSETESRALQAFLIKENVRTLIDDAPADIAFTAVVANGGEGSIATPHQGNVHVGDQITLEAIPARNYMFVSWQMNGTAIGTTAQLLYTLPPLGEGITSAVFTATFALAPVAWASEVSPAEASTAGCLAFPPSGTVEANGAVPLIAVEATGYTFSHWERNGASIGTNRILSATATPLAEGEDACVYTAFFTAG